MTGRCVLGIRTPDGGVAHSSALCYFHLATFDCLQHIEMILDVVERAVIRQFPHKVENSLFRTHAMPPNLLQELHVRFSLKAL